MAFERLLEPVRFLDALADAGRSAEISDGAFAMESVHHPLAPLHAVILEVGADVGRIVNAFLAADLDAIWHDRTAVFERVPDRRQDGRASIREDDDRFHAFGRQSLNVGNRLLGVALAVGVRPADHIRAAACFVDADGGCLLPPAVVGKAVGQRYGDFLGPAEVRDFRFRLRAINSARDFRAPFGRRSHGRRHHADSHYRDCRGSGQEPIFPLRSHLSPPCYFHFRRDFPSPTILPHDALLRM